MEEVSKKIVLIEFINEDFRVLQFNSINKYLDYEYDSKADYTLLASIIPHLPHHSSKFYLFQDLELMARYLHLVIYALKKGHSRNKVISTFEFIHKDKFTLIQ